MSKYNVEYVKRILANDTGPCADLWTPDWVSFLVEELDDLRAELEAAKTELAMAITLLHNKGERTHYDTIKELEASREREARLRAALEAARNHVLHNQTKTAVGIMNAALETRPTISEQVFLKEVTNE